MDDRDFDELLAKVVRELGDKQNSLGETYGVGTFPKWWLDIEAQTLQFQDVAGKSQLVAEVVNIGSFSAKSETWKWAWSNESLPVAARTSAALLRELEQITGMALFGDSEAIGMDEVMAWEMAAFAVWHLGAIGCYRAPSSTGPQVFLAIRRLIPANRLA